MGLSVNPMKMEVIIFTRNDKSDKTCTLKIGGEELTPKSIVRYLGVILDSKLSWKEQLDNAIELHSQSLRQNLGIKIRKQWMILRGSTETQTHLSGALVWWERSNLARAKKCLTL